MHKCTQNATYTVDETVVPSHAHGNINNLRQHTKYTLPSGTPPVSSCKDILCSIEYTYVSCSDTGIRSGLSSVFHFKSIPRSFFGTFNVDRQLCEITMSSIIISANIKFA